MALHKHGTAPEHREIMAIATSHIHHASEVAYDVSSLIFLLLFTAEVKHTLLPYQTVICSANMYLSAVAMLHTY